MNPFTILGTASNIFQLADILWFYSLRPSDGYKKYQKGPQPYAVVTNATDGIGKSIAKDLYRKGFNVILHGRSEKKLRATVAEIKPLREGGFVESFVADGAGARVDYAGIMRRFGDLNITLLVNNVGETYPKRKKCGTIHCYHFYTDIEIRRTKKFEEWSEDDHLSFIKSNVLFPTLLTRAFLPSLRKTSLSHPVLVVFNGSVSPEFSVSDIPLYTATEAFAQQLSSSLSADEKLTPGESKIEFMYLHRGSVQSSSTAKPGDSSRQTSDDYAAHLVNTFGSGRENVVPLAEDKIKRAVMGSLPDFIQQAVLKEEAKKVTHRGRG